MRVGIDIGSTYSKLALLDDESNILETLEIKTGFSSLDSYQKLLNSIKNKDFNISNCRIASTGYGRDIVEKAEKKITEITCHSKGARKIFEKEDFTLIDIGGQDTKVIDIENGKVNDFLMNDKCSAGTGRFLDVMAKNISESVEELLMLSSKCKDNSVKISSLCTVFAESEVISLIGQSVDKEKIAHAIVLSIAEKVSSLAVKIRNFGFKPIFLTGGLCDSEIFINELSTILKTKVLSNHLGRFAGAIGAALSLEI